MGGDDRNDDRNDAAGDGEGDGTPSRDGAGPDGRDRLAEELRALALLALDRLDPLLDRVREALQDDGPGPVCARCAEPLPGVGSPARQADGGRPVQHIPVERVPVRPAAADRGGPGGSPC